LKSNLFYLSIGLHIEHPPIDAKKFREIDLLFLYFTKIS